MIKRANGHCFAFEGAAGLVGDGVGGVLGYFSPLVPSVIGLVNDAVINFFEILSSILCS